MLLAVLVTKLAFDALTTQIELKDGWSLSETRPDTPNAPTAGWTKTSLPKFDFLPNTGIAGGMWFKRKFAPIQCPGKNAYLVIDQGLYFPEVFVDGVRIDTWSDGWTPHSTDLTAFANDGRSHDVAVHFHDRNAANKDGYVYNGALGESSLQGKVLYPLGGYKDLTGFVGQVWLKTVPKAHIDERSLVIKTSVRNHTFDVSGTVTSAPPNSIVRFIIGGRAPKPLMIPSETAPVSASGQFHLHTKLPKVGLWAPETPALYTLCISLEADGKVLHQTWTQVGFKEIWTSGPDFYLNGVKRHFLATSTWPVADHLERWEIRDRLKRVKALGCNAVRYHLCPWQKEFLDVADEVGLMVVDEAPVYTDGSGFYAYKDPRFWENYQTVVKGLIQRDRNHPCLMMWSLGNEIRFMGNERYDADLPKKMGNLARFARSIDPIHPLTFEADQDPDGAFDVIGLHYPHELPFQDDYPVTCDWLAERSKTDALGGMLGTKSTDFAWERKKPLYIGEYLWVPFGDYSPATVFFGEDAYRNRDRMNSLAIAQSWIYQTIGYRRAGVSGLCPWSSFAFGFEHPNPPLSDAQAFSMRPLAVYLREGDHRCIPGGRVTLGFDLFNDTDTVKPLDLRVRGLGQLEVRHVELAPGSTAPIHVELVCPKAMRPGKAAIGYEVRCLREIVGYGHPKATILPANGLVAPPGWRLKTLGKDGIGSWSTTGSTRTVAVIEKGFLPQALSAGLLPWISQGGRALVLEQSDLTSLGVRVVEHGSTMAFPTGALFQDEPESLKFWGKSLYVADKQLARTGVGGWRTLSATGGLNGLALAPSMARTYGKGYILLSQWHQEAAGRAILQGSLNWLCAQTQPKQGSVWVIGADGDQGAALKRLRLKAVFDDDSTHDSLLDGAGGLVICGKEGTAGALRNCLRKAERLGLPIFWWSPAPNTFNAVKAELNASDLNAAAWSGIPVLSDRMSPLLQGVTREELTLTTPASGWNHTISPKTGTCSVEILPSTSFHRVKTISAAELKPENGSRMGNEIRFDRRGKASADLTVLGGIYELKVMANVAETDRKAFINVNVNGDRCGCAYLQPGASGGCSLLANLEPGLNHIEIEVENGADWGGGPLVSLQSIQVSGPITYPAKVHNLAMPGAIASWDAGKSKVVVCGYNPQSDRDNVTKCDLTLGALLGNLGMPFEAR